MTPQTQRAITPSVTIGRMDSPIGPLWLAVADASAVAVYWRDGNRRQESDDDTRQADTAQADTAQADASADVIPPGLRGDLHSRGLHDLHLNHDGVDLLRVPLARYFRGEALADVPVSWVGMTPFTAAVLTALNNLPTGALTTYGGLARATGRSIGTARAIGGAVGRNPLPIVVPCHRVLAGDNLLGGFTGGLARKRWLLAHEGLTWREPKGARAAKNARENHSLTA